MQQDAGRLDQLADEEWDLLVIGGGIVGAGVARDAAMRGLRVALVDRHDFAFGTSSRSSRLLHGGLRYLAQGRVGLVREASREKVILHQIAPHLATPLPFLFPTYRKKTWPRWQLSAGVKIYDLLCGRQNLGPSSTLSTADMLDKLPGLSEAGLTGGVRYFDGFTNDARLVIDTMRSAVKHGAVVGNYLELVTADRSADVWRCCLHDHLKAQDAIVTARAIVNAAGCWAGQMPYSGVRLRLTKGVHLVVDRHRFECPEAVVMMRGPRVLFAIPWGERVILGTTDTDYSGSLEQVDVEPTDVQYILDVVNEIFPQAVLKPHDVLARWAGIRPLIAGKSSEQGTPSNTSRNHRIQMSQPAWFDVAGGKLTTYRLMAQQTVDRIVAQLPGAFGQCQTADEPLLTPADAKGVSSTVPPPVSRELVEHFCDMEWARHLDDVMVRRTSWIYYHAQPYELSCQVAQWMGERMEWDSRRQEAELQNLQLWLGSALWQCLIVRLAQKVGQSH